MEIWLHLGEEKLRFSCFLTYEDQQTLNVIVLFTIFKSSQDRGPLWQVIPLPVESIKKYFTKERY